MTPQDKKQHIARLKKLMMQSSKDMDFESAARFRDLIASLSGSES
jgi:excinuclease UvrABC nuclease subunit